MKMEAFYQQIPSTRLRALSRDLEGSAYWYFAPLVARQIARLRECLQGHFQVQYAVKANAFPPLLAFIADQGVGADVSSGGELQAVLEAGFDPAKLSFSGPAKTHAELARAVACGLGAVNVENVAELDTLAALARDQNRAAGIALRLNPARQTLKSGLKMAGDTQFGLSEEDLPAALERLRAHADVLHFQGIHVHAGSQILDAQSVVDNLHGILDLALRFEADSGLSLKKVNCGGGWGIDYFPNQNPLDLPTIQTGLAQLFASETYRDLAQRAELIIEPGRFIAAECGVYASKVLYRKTMRGKTFAIVEGGMHHHYLLAGGMGQVLRRNFALDLLPDPRQPEPTLEPEVMDVAGSLCTPQDVLATSHQAPFPVRPGDTVVFFNSGAYGLSASPVNFLGHPMPGQHWLDRV